MTSSFIQRRMGRAHCSMAIAVNLVLIITATAQPRDRERYQITVRSLEFGSPELVTYNLDGSDPRRFEAEGVDGHDPAWSPDGRRLVFGDDGQIVLLDLDTMKRTILTSGPGYKHVPAWSPDGKAIAFLNSVAGKRHVYVVASDASEIFMLDSGPEETDYFDPAWSPGGKTLAYVAGGGIVFLDTETQNRVRSGIREAWRPAWSPTGGMIGFHRSSQIFVSSINGASERQLTEGKGHHDSAVWSRDGKYIAYRYFIEVPSSDQPELPSGDLILFDIVNETHTTILKGKLPRLGSRPTWKPPVGIERE